MCLNKGVFVNKKIFLLMSILIFSCSAFYAKGSAALFADKRGFTFGDVVYVMPSFARCKVVGFKTTEKKPFQVIVDLDNGTRLYVAYCALSKTNREGITSE